MSHIILWRASHRDPFVDVDSKGFIETYPDYDTAKKEAEQIEKDENESSKSLWYFDHKIYKEVDS